MKITYFALLFFCYVSNILPMQTREITLSLFSDKKLLPVCAAAFGAVSVLGSTKAVCCMGTDHCDIFLNSFVVAGSALAAIMSSVLYKSWKEDIEKTIPISLKKVRRQIAAAYSESPSKKSLDYFLQKLKRNNKKLGVILKMEKHQQQIKEIKQKINLLEQGPLFEALNNDLPPEICVIICSNALEGLKSKHKKMSRKINLNELELKELLQLSGSLQAIKLHQTLDAHNKWKVDSAGVIYENGVTSYNCLATAYVKLRFPGYPWQADS